MPESDHKTPPLSDQLHTYRDKVKFTFPEGSSLPDPEGLLAVGAGVRRAIDLHEGDTVDAEAFQAVIRAAVQLNTAPKG
ncbi:DUF1801 domain-containing protein [Agreia sp. PsM10]|uniref:DUF1801 domain-containing protein n=1 Tax=Agreia sp. PsM10 TaxID=3030533 RepID=UPI00263B8058|nr:DUF1801 domain-containing protein [Agreia sp. PsM10]MDN4640798.1 DUF1801 domain-containing protein [Agreia sp. PsM10]